MMLQLYFIFPEEKLAEEKYGDKLYTLSIDNVNTAVWKLNTKYLYCTSMPLFVFDILFSTLATVFQTIPATTFKDNSKIT